jgi:hypothetical protein
LFVVVLVAPAFATTSMTTVPAIDPRIHRRQRETFRDIAIGIVRATPSSSKLSF